MKTRKSEAVKQLENLTFEYKKKASSMPDHCIPKPRFSEKDTNGLTKCIVAFINLQDNAFAWRVNNMGVYDQAKGRYRTPGTRKGIADISAIREGNCYQIEVKRGKDRMSEAQKDFKSRVEAANGIYIIARDLASFMEIWEAA